MDRPSGQSQPPPTSSPGHRDMMFCHACHDEWYRDERGLICPECGSDFTQIIENDDDPRDHERHHDDDDDSMPDLEAAPPPLHPVHHHNPWRETTDDPEEGDISNGQWRQLGPGRYAFSMNTSRTISSQPGPGPFDATTGIGPFAGLLNTIIGGGPPMGQAPNQRNRHQDTEGRDTPGATTGSGTLPGGHRFTYSSTARLIPRDTDGGPSLHPQDELNNVLVGIMAAFGEPTAHHHHHEFGEENNPNGQHMNPFLNLFAQMMPGSGQPGDFVYSQEALDRIVTQLMEQTQMSSAPGPAPQSEIDALPQNPVTVDMLGSEGRAECSICMDEVNIGEKVTELPCRHWFHHQCVAAWLAEHDTCPHCRKGISKNSNENRQASGGASGADPSRQPPGAFVSEEGTYADPFVVHESPSHNTHGGADTASRSGSTEGPGSGSLGDRIRRGLFGPPR